MNNLNIFTNKEFGEKEVIVIVKDGIEYIEAIPSAQMLGYSNPRDALNRHCENHGVVFHDVAVVTGKRLDGTDKTQVISKKFIDEGNLYRLILRSKLKNAKRFERWVMDEVLPSVRRNGTYMKEEIIEKTLNNPDLLIELAKKLKYEKFNRIKFETQSKELQQAISKDKPYTNFGKSIAASDDAITIGQFARLLNNGGINVGRNRLFSFLRDNNYLIKSGLEKNMPKQIYMEQGLFKVKERIIDTENGEKIATITLLTGKGQLHFINVLNNLYFNQSRN